MANKNTPKALAAALGATFVASMAAAPVASADQNPFSMKPLSSGYQVAGMDGNCGGKKGRLRPSHHLLSGGIEERADGRMVVSVFGHCNGTTIRLACQAALSGNGRRATETGGGRLRGPRPAHPVAPRMPSWSA